MSGRATWDGVEWYTPSGGAVRLSPDEVPCAVEVVLDDGTSRPMLFNRAGREVARVVVDGEEWVRGPSRGGAWRRFVDSITGPNPARGSGTGGRI